MTFSDLNLNTPLLNALGEMGLVHPTTIQQRAFPVIMSGKDVLGIAQTGTGKTIAFLLPSLRQWKFQKNRIPQILILVPTRELVVQVVEVTEKLAAYTNVVVKGVYGGVNMKTQAYDISEGMDVLVATPGRLRDLALDGFVSLKGVKKFVLDEVDEMLDMGFRHQLTSIFDLLPARRQNLLFSATVTPDVEALIDVFFTAPELIEAAPTGTPLENIKQTGFEVPNFNTKLNLLELLLRENKDMTKVLVFTATKNMADIVYDKMDDLIPETFGVVHSDKAQNFRFKMVKDFDAGEIRVLIATDLVSRGLDITDVSHVVNFDMPDEAESYMHRIGRTGRADKPGDAISFITPRDEENQAEVEALMNMEIPIVELPENLIVSEELTEFDKDKVGMRNTLIKQPKRVSSGAAFHDKNAKNKKINNKIRHTDKMWAKYGKPKTRGQKKKK
jgi:ATP-dependent RNA helicase RhlE